MSNPYHKSAILGTQEFLSTVYILMLKKIKRLKEIELQKKRNKLPLPLLKEKLETTSKILEAIRELGLLINFETKEGPVLGDVLNDLGIMLGNANLAETSKEAIKNYEIAQIILEAFIKNPDE